MNSSEGCPPDGFILRKVVRMKKKKELENDVFEN
jgi:hypothetical protein